MVAAGLRWSALSIAALMNPLPLWKEAAQVHGVASFFYSDCHGRDTVRNLVGLDARQHPFERAIEKLTFAPDHLIFFPEELLEILHPLEIADHHAAGIAQDVGNNKDLVLAPFEHEIRFRRCRPVSPPQQGLGT